MGLERGGKEESNNPSSNLHVGIARERFSLATLGRVQSGVLDDCFESSILVQGHSSHKEGIVALSSMVTSWKR